MRHQRVCDWLADPRYVPAWSLGIQLLVRRSQFKSGGSDGLTQRSVQQLVLYVDIIAARKWTRQVSIL